MLLYAATGDAVARIEDNRVELALEGSGARCIAADPTDGRTLYVGCRDDVRRTDDGGRTWQDCALPAPDVYSVAVGPYGAVYAGVEPSRLFRSDDRGATWRELEALQRIPSKPTWSFPPRPWTSHVRWIAPSPHDPDLLLVGIELGGLMRSADGGASFDDHRPGAERDVHTLAWHLTAEGRAYEAGGGGSAWSRDGGDTWEPADAGRDRNYTWAVTPHPDDPDTWFVSASPGPFNAHRRGRAEAYVYRWRGSGPWERLDGGLPQPLDAMPYALVFAGETLYAGLSDGRLYASADGGDSWRAVDLGGDRLDRITALAPVA